MTEVKINQLLDPAHLARIENYALMARTAIEGFLSGLHRSVLHGFGIEFHQYRNYTPGEDLKLIDWKVYARRKKLYAKVFEEETNTNCYILLDCSASLGYRGSSSPCSKFDYARMIAACMAYLASRQGDNVGLFCYSDTLFSLTGPKNRPGQLARVLQGLTTARAKGQSCHEKAFQYLEKHVKSRGLVVFLSDMLEGEESLPRLFKRLRTAHYDCLALQVLDPDEINLPGREAVRYIDSESGRAIVTSPRAIAQSYRYKMKAFLDQLSRNLNSVYVDYQLLHTDMNLGHALARYLDRRAKLR